MELTHPPVEEKANPEATWRNVGSPSFSKENAPGGNLGDAGQPAPFIKDLIIPERRKRPTPPLSRYWLIGRRRGAPDGTPTYVDRYHKDEWVLILGLLVLSIWDAVFTVTHVANGGQEINPLLSLVLAAQNYAGFVWIKLSVTLLCIVFLLIHIRFWLVKTLITLVLIMYSFLLALHVYNAFSWAYTSPLP